MWERGVRFAGKLELGVIHEAVEMVLEFMEDIDKGENLNKKRRPRTEPCGPPVVIPDTFTNQVNKENRID